MSEYRPKERQDPQLKVTPDSSSPGDSAAYGSGAPNLVPRTASSKLRELDNLPNSDSPVFGFVALCVALLFYGFAYISVFGNPWQAHWVETQGVVTEVKQGFKGKRSVSYAYKVNGEQFSNHETYNFYGYSVNTGTPIIVRYEPGKPNFSVIKTGANTATWLSLIAGTFGLIICLGILFPKPLKR